MAIGAVFSGIGTAYRAIRWVLAAKKKLESDAKGYLSPDRAKALRLWLERMFKALEEGEANPNYARLPKIVRWLATGHDVDVYVGEFGQNVLKSGKLEANDPALRKELTPPYPMH